MLFQKKLVFNSNWPFLDTFNFNILILFLMLNYCSVWLKMICISVTLTLKIFLNAIIMPNGPYIHHALSYTVCCLSIYLFSSKRKHVVRSSVKKNVM